MGIKENVYTKLVLAALIILYLPNIYALDSEEDSILMDAVWIPDNGDGTYTNPILYADYSDPDIVKVGSDFYMVASSFNCAPGVPVLHSKDLVNWTIIGHVFENQPPDTIYDNPGHGVGVWAPSIRYHNGEFYVYYADPDYGIYLGKATNAAGPWDHKLVQSSYGWIDPCPFWDDNDSAYLVHSYAKSRTGFNSFLTLRRMSTDGETISLTDTIILFDGTDPAHPRKTIEGPKMHKRNGYYYVFAPYDGVANGSQAVLRADTIIGPYKDSTILERGSTAINGPHQGGWVELESGEFWFMHFQKKLPYGRIVHLQPMQWINDWPFIGEDYDMNGIGEPVSSYAKPDVGSTFSIANPQASDKFDSLSMNPQWQWHSNFNSSWYSLSENPGNLRLFAVNRVENYKNLWSEGSMILQKLPAEKFSVTAKVTPKLKTGEVTGLVIMANRYGFVGIQQTDTGLVIGHSSCNDAQNGQLEIVTPASMLSITDTTVYLRARLKQQGVCDFSYSVNGIYFHPIGKAIATNEGRWIGAKVGLFCQRPFENIGDAGYADYAWCNVDYYYNKLPGATSNPYPNSEDSIVVDSKFKLIWNVDEVFTDSVYVYFGTESDPTTLAGKQKRNDFYPGTLVKGETYYWRVDAINDKGATNGPVWSFTVKDILSSNPVTKSNGFNLEQNKPNPFSEYTNISFSIPNSAQAKLSIYNIMGSMVEIVTNEQYTGGTHSIKFYRNNLTSGIYLIQLETEDKKIVKKMMVQ